MSCNTLKISLPIALISLVIIASISGCATNRDINSLQLQIDALQKTAADSLATANSAKDMSNANLIDLESVRQTANSALKLTKDNHLKINQIFNRSLKK